MKLRKLLLGGAAAVLALSSFAFLSCSTDSEEDDELTVSINATYNSDKSSATVTMTPSETTYGDSSTKIYIAYTLDGSEPKVDKADSADLTKVTSSTSISDLKQYVDYGSADIYEDSLTFTEDTTINAKAFYISDGTLHYGVLATVKIDITETTTTSTSTDSDSNAYGDLTFDLASSGNSLSIHYFDTSDKTFKYTYDGTEYSNCYYQFQFSYKSSTSGNWYLYIRQLGTQSPIGTYASTGHKYLTNGTYTDSNGVFNVKKTTPLNNGTFAMYDVDGNTFDDDVTMTDDSFVLSITSDTTDSSGTTTKGNLTTAVDASNAK